MLKSLTGFFAQNTNLHKKVLQSKKKQGNKNSQRNEKKKKAREGMIRTKIEKGGIRMNRIMNPWLVFSHCSV